MVKVIVVNQKVTELLPRIDRLRAEKESAWNAWITAPLPMPEDEYAALQKAYQTAAAAAAEAEQEFAVANAPDNWIVVEGPVLA